MKNMVWGFVATVFFSASGAFSGIISGTDTIIYNHNICFSPHSITPLLSGVAAGRAGFVYKCTTSAGQIDLFVVEELLGTCMYICHTLAIGSPRPFYVSKKDLGAMNLLSPLAVQDTGLFTRYDTGHYDIHVQDSNCYLPHIAPLGTNGPTIGPDNFIVIKNAAGKYIMVQFEVVVGTGTYYSPMPITYTYLRGYVIRWYLQTDGTLNFGDITRVRVKFPRDQAVTEERLGMKEILQGIYNIKGQRMARDDQRIRKTAGVMLIKKGGTVMRVFR